MSTIVTFYSYKGGVGRSMALANVALLLARRGLRVLAVDWDLEAPGLDRYFAALKVEPGGPGLLRLIADAARGGAPDYREYLWKVTDPTARAELAFLPSGRESDDDYARALDRFDWRAFFAERDGGGFIERLRQRWREDYDVVLIDSRTGLTDTGGICTIQLPDVVVAVFTANYQSLYGVRDVLRLAQKARQSLAYDRMPLTIFPLPSRFSSRAEFQEAREWIERFEEALAEFYRDWLPKWSRPRSVLERVKVPQIDYFGFGEKLAVLEQGVSDPEGMGFVYQRVADLLARDFADIESWLGPDARAEAQREGTGPKVISSEVSATPPADYEFDLYVSYAHSPMLADWLRQFIQLLTGWVEQLTGSKLRVFLDVTEIRLEDVWSGRQSAALSRSKLLLALLTPQYFRSQWSLAEWRTFQQRSETTGARLLLPVLVSGGQLVPEEFNRYQYLDVREYVFTGNQFRKSRLYLEFEKKVKELAEAVSEMLTEAPPFDPAWPVATPGTAAPAEAGGRPRPARKRRPPRVKRSRSK
jgi:MinD-like ATPase involved in chromosome partitioning or flagellar assembly